MTAQFLLPRPKDWPAFEDIVCDLYARRLSEPNLKRFGRAGQRQFGIDSVTCGITGITAIQCKHYPEGLSIGDVDAAVLEAEKFQPPLSSFVITTSAHRDAVVHKHVVTLDASRRAASQFQVDVAFWDDLCNWLSDYPDLLFKHFGAWFLRSEHESVSLPARGIANRKTLRGTVSGEETADARAAHEGRLRHRGLLVGPPAAAGLVELRAKDVDQKAMIALIRAGLIESSAAASRPNPYEVAVAVSTFGTSGVADTVELAIDWTDLFSDDSAPADSLAKAASALTDVKAALDDSRFAKSLVVHVQARLTAAFLVGWTFRSVTKYSMRIVSGNEVWTTGGLPEVVSGLTERFPQVYDDNGTEAAFALNISRDIHTQVETFVKGRTPALRGLISFELPGHKIRSAAHALSIANELAMRLKSAADSAALKRIHLFAAAPAPLMLLLGHKLNALCPVEIYYSNAERNLVSAGALPIPGGT